ncbi:hypothetical protein [Vampirovibrio chlorellavorus]|uniref:hypothetical protein n=1 Tax=Vampirovibrio chlorellavorus TaxID=758823 RepID=UPI0026EBA312|nr:hypothetical protein [Vampirovibrio chlorellavorus]
MERLLEASTSPRIIVSDTLGPSARRLVDAARFYETILLIYEDDFSDSLLGAWAERDRLRLNTRYMGEIMEGIEVRSFGMLDFSPGTVLEIHLREATLSPADASDHLRRMVYRSLLNEICQITVKAYPQEDGRILLS